MIIEDTTTQESRTPIAWVYQEEGYPKFLVISDQDNYTAISTFGVSVNPKEFMRNPYASQVIKHYYKGDKISFTVEEGDWL